MLHLLIQTLAAAVATVGFSLLFGVPARYYPSCALIGGVSWLAGLSASASLQFRIHRHFRCYRDRDPIVQVVRCP